MEAEPSSSHEDMDRDQGNQKHMSSPRANLIEVIEVGNRAGSGPVDVTVDILAPEVESEVPAAEGLACTE